MQLLITYLSHVNETGLWCPLQWRHNERVGVSNHQPQDCLPNRLFKAQIKENTKAPRHWPLCGEFTGDRWIPRMKGQWRVKCFHLMTSSWLTDLAETKRTGRVQTMWLFSVGPNCIKTTTRQHPMVVTSNTEITGNVGLILLYSSRASHRPYTLSAIMIAFWMWEGWKCWHQRNDI